MADESSASIEADNEPSTKQVKELRRTIRVPETDSRFEVPLRGVDVGPDTRCAHYHGPRDIVAIRFPCCDAFYPCFACHKETTDHEARRWSADRFHAPAVLCGPCDTVLSIRQYLDTDHTCPSCGESFNPGCAHHHDRYFCQE